MTTYRQFFKTRALSAFSRFFEDFNIYTAAHWTVTEVGDGTQAVAAGAGGLLAVTTAATDNDSVNMQLINETFRHTSGKKWSFVARFKVDDATDSDLLIGLAITDTTLIAGMSDGIYFKKDDGDAILDFYQTKNSLSDTVAATSVPLADNTFTTVEMYYDGDTTIECFVDGTGCGKLTVGTNTPDDEDLAVSLAIQAGEAEATVLTVDYIDLWQER